MRVATSLLLVILAAVQTAAAPGDWTPPRYRGGAAPAIQVRAVGGGEVYAELDVDPSGAVTRVSVLRETSPYTDPVAKTLASWKFSPAEQLEPATPNGPPRRKRAVRSRVFVAAIFRPPTINTPTYGEVPRPVRPASTDVPFPTVTTMPQFPPNRLFDGVVLVEVKVAPDGSVTDAAVVQSAAGFDQPALEAARQWRFHGARVDYDAVPAYAYIAFAFRQPVTVAIPGMGDR